MRFYRLQILALVTLVISGCVPVADDGYGYGYGDTSYGGSYPYRAPGYRVDIYPDGYYRSEDGRQFRSRAERDYYRRQRRAERRQRAYEEDRRHDRRRADERRRDRRDADRERRRDRGNVDRERRRDRGEERRERNAGVARRSAPPVDTRAEGDRIRIEQGWQRTTRDGMPMWIDPEGRLHSE